MNSDQPARMRSRHQPSAAGGGAMSGETGTGCTPPGSARVGETLSAAAAKPPAAMPTDGMSPALMRGFLESWRRSGPRRSDFPSSTLTVRRAHDRGAADAHPGDPLAGMAYEG